MGFRTALCPCFGMRLPWAEEVLYNPVGLGMSLRNASSIRVGKDTITQSISDL